MDEKKKDIRKPTEHSMGRRSFHKNYVWRGMYHVTISVNKVLYQPLGKVVGDANEPEGSANAPRIELTEVGRMVEEELTSSISRHYPMIEVQDYVVMPEHLHALVAVKGTIVSANGRETHLGQVIAGFKKGCNRRYWEMTGTKGVEPYSLRMIARGEATSDIARGEPSLAGRGTGAGEGTGAGKGDLCLAVDPQSVKDTPSDGTTDRQPLFEKGYVDVMPVDEAQLEAQRAYIHDNPRSRLLRTVHRAQLQAQRMNVSTALGVRALKKYLLQVCHPSQIDDEQWTGIEQRLLTQGGMVACDSYGAAELLTRRLLPVVCHRKDRQLFEQQKARCLEAAAEGAVLVSARIAQGEQTIMDEAIARGYAVVLVVDNGFPEIYHPSQAKIERCVERRLLLVSPWRYRYRLAEDGISVAECKAMNCVAQALCRTRDDWWRKNPGG